MRAEQWAILIVGGLGAYAVYRAVTNKPSQPSPEDIPILKSGPDAPPVLLQNVIGKNAPAGSASLRVGTAYRGRLEVSPAVTREQLASELQGLGFSDVSIYANLAEAQSGDAIPLPGALANPTPGSRWFQAVWRGPCDAPNQHACVRPLPRELVLLWPTVSLSTPTAPHTAGWYGPQQPQQRGYFLSSFAG